MALHSEFHPAPVSGCFGCKVSSLKVAYCNSAGGNDFSRQKAWDRELQEYRDAKAQGIAPDTTKTRGIRAAVEWSNKTGVAYSADRKDDYDRSKAQERL
jgi:hypothetical protein